ncbi:MAG: hypothetical protein Q8910_11940 [Bacteroidota bacterium]|nr:hypothetical protein [Bacteroidota bacterium]
MLTGEPAGRAGEDTTQRMPLEALAILADCWPYHPTDKEGGPRG